MSGNPYLQRKILHIFRSKSASDEQKSELYLFGSILIWSFFPIFTILGYSKIPPLFSASIVMLIAAVFFAFWLTFTRQWKVKIQKAWKYILGVTLINGVLYYLLAFTALRLTTAGDQSIVAQMEVFFTMFVLSLFKKEKVKLSQFVGALFMVAGILLILFDGSLETNKGNIIMLVAAAIPGMGNYYQKVARKYASSAQILFWRSLIAGSVLFFIAMALESPPSLSEIKSSWWILLINGALIMGLSKIAWIESLHYSSVIKSSALSVIGPAFTLIFAFIILKETPEPRQIAGFLPILFGVLLLSDFSKNNRFKRYLDRD